MALLAAMLYVANSYLSRFVGEELSAWIVVFLGVFLVHGVFEYVPDLYARWEAHRHRQK